MIGTRELMRSKSSIESEIFASLRSPASAARHSSTRQLRDACDAFSIAVLVMISRE